MKVELFVLYDRKAGVYTTPQAFQNKAMAVRYFKYFMDEPQNKYLKEDTELYSIGDYNTDTGIVQATTKPEFVCNFVEVN